MFVFRLLSLVGLLTITASIAIGQVTVDFTADQTEGCGSLQVNFCDNSSSTDGPIVSWAWNLGGVTSSNECQGRIFGSPGNYEICLTVTDSEGNSGTICQTDFIVIHPLPQPDFEADNIEGCIPMTSAFTYTGSSNITEYIWGLQGSTGVITTDGSSSPDAESTYSIADQFTISLTVTDINGCTDFITKDNYINTFEPPVVEASANQTQGCNAPFQVTFSNDNLQPNMNYSWDFGNGATFSGNTPPPVWYTNEGSYTVTVIGLNGNNDCRDTLVLENYVNVGYDVDFSFTPEEGCEDLVVSFTDNSPSTASDVLWDFGDGNTSSASNPTHTYLTPGSYTVSLSRTVEGCTTTESSSTEITVFELPEVAYNNDNTLGCSVPHNVNFSGVSADAIEWSWDFGDGTISTDQNPNHVYNDFGIYTVSLTVTNANGCESTISTTDIEVIETQASVTQLDFNGCAPLNINLSDNSTTVIPINDWLWELDLPSGMITSTDAQPNFVIPDTGCFDLTLTVTNILGCSDTQTFSEAICAGSDPLANFNASPTVACVDEEISFSDLSTAFVDTWLWTFGDGGESEIKNPIHAYADTGFFDVTLTVLDNGCIGTLALDNYIEVTAPRSIFSVVQNCETHEYVEFVNQSIEADSSFWDFGVVGVDTDTSSLENPTFTFPETGEYTITLTTFNFNTGCSHELTRLIYVHDPLSSFSIPETQGCAPFTLQPTNSSAFGVTYQWSGVGINFSDAGIAEPDITFPDAGTYSDIQLIVIDINDCADTSIYTQTIFANEITPDFTPDDIGGCQPFEVTFNENSSNMFSNNIQWDWNFENGVGTESGQIATHTFEDLGEHAVSLTVTDEWGCTATLNLPTAVEVTSPVASFAADTFSCTDYGVTFTSASTGLNLTYNWDFGDGNSSTDPNPVYMYPAEGIYTPCLTVTDEYGCTNTICQDNLIEIADPVSSFSVDNNYASCPPFVANFQNLSTNASSYLWDFGDGSGPSDLENPSHVYTIPGVYDVTLIANSTTNCADTFIIQDLVVLDGPLGDFHYEVDTSCAPVRVTFFAESQGSFTYVWDFGDGSPLMTITNVSADTTVYEYTTAGTYTPSLGIIDQIGCERILEAPVSIFVPELSIDFQASQTVMCDENNPITFLNLIGSTGPLDSLRWMFDQGDPLTSTEFEPTVVFNGPGLYDVTLIAHNSYCSDTLVVDDYIRIGDIPDASFTVSDVLGCAPLNVEFTDITNVVNGVVDQWHWKFGDGFESFQQQPSHNYTYSNSFEAQLIVTTDVGCVDSVTQTIDVMPQPDISISGDQEICTGETTQLTAQIISDPTGVTYYWENSPTLSCTDCLTPIANPIDTTVYTFVAVSADGCETVTTIQIDVRPETAPVIMISNDTTMCVNDVIQLFVYGGNDVFSYNWDNSQSGLSCYDNCLNPIASPLASTTYTVTVTNNSGCSSIGSVQVDVVDQNIPFAGEDQTICLGESTQLNLSMGNNPVWLVSDGLDCSTCPNPNASPQVSTDFVAQVTTDEGCDIVDTVRVNVVSQQDIEAGDDIIICRDETTVLDGQYFYQNAVNPIFAWTPAGSLDNASSQNPLAAPQESTVYYFTVTEGNCTLRDSVLVEITDKTQIEGQDYFVCEGDTAFIELIGSADQFEWIPAEGLSNPNIANPFHVPNQPITYTVIATAGSCEPDTAEVNINFNEIPDVNIPSTFNFFEGEPILLDIENTSSDYSFEWFPIDGLSCIDCSAPTFLHPENVEYTITVSNIFTGCQKTLTTNVVKLDECMKEQIGAPNVFTPNDDGENDELVIKYSSALLLDNFQLQIFDRWGAMVYETDDINSRWDGRIDGKLAPSGVYIYFIEFPCHLDGRIIQKKGDITIYR